MVKVAVLVSGGGTNLGALFSAIDEGIIKNAEIACVISSNKKAYALERAKERAVPCEVLEKRDFSSPDDFDAALISTLLRYDIGLVVLAGYMLILSQRVTRAYENRIINVHPSLIPSFCGDGYYGLKVHESALRYGVKVTGATVHFVNEVTDGGAIILQKAVEVMGNDTPETLQRRVMEQAEWIILPLAVELFCSGRLYVSNNKVAILDNAPLKTRD